MGRQSRKSYQLQSLTNAISNCNALPYHTQPRRGCVYRPSWNDLRTQALRKVRSNVECRVLPPIRVSPGGSSASFIRHPLCPTQMCPLILVFELDTGCKPSTRFPPERLLEIVLFFIEIISYLLFNYLIYDL